MSSPSPDTPLTVAVAFSGGLDTSFLAARAAAAGHRVLAITVDTGGWTEAGREALAAHARALGAEPVVVDGRDALYEDHVAWLIRGHVLRGGVYPLCVGVERVVQARLFAEEAARRGADVLQHGSTAAGNDQVRFDVALRVLAPGARVEAPIRDEGWSREDSAAWLAARGLGPMQEDAAYSINRGLWGTTAGGAETHDPWAEPGPECWTTTVDPAEAPPAGQEVVIRFEEGLPVAVDGEAISGWRAVERLAEVGARHGVGRGIHLGDTITGIKGRIAFEAPAAAILLPAHRELEKLVLSPAQRAWKDRVAEAYGDMLHEARFLDPFMRDAEALIASSQARVSGEARVRLRQGTVTVTGVRSPWSVVAVQDAAYGEASALWSAADAAGFCRVFAVGQLLHARAAAQGRQP